MKPAIFVVSDEKNQNKIPSPKHAIREIYAFLKSTKSTEIPGKAHRREEQGGKSKKGKYEQREKREEWQ